MRNAWLLVIATALVVAMPARAAANCTGWRLVGSDTFRGQDALLRSQGVTTDERGWFFSWQGGLQRTLDAYTPVAAATLPPELPLAGDDHIGDIDHVGRGRPRSPGGLHRGVGHAARPPQRLRPADALRALPRAAVPAELEGLAIRPTPDGGLLHVLIVMNNDLPDDATQIHVSFNHYAPCSRRG